MSASMSFGSVLFNEPQTALAAELPECFRDLHLDQVVAAATAGREEYDLQPFYSTSLASVEAVRYRQDVIDDLLRPDVRERVDGFAEEMRAVRRRLSASQKLRQVLQQRRWFLEAACAYGQAVRRLAEGLSDVELRSEGLGGLRTHVVELVADESFVAMQDQAHRVADDLAEVTYLLSMRGLTVRVTRYDDEPDYAAEVARDFAKFRQGDVEDHRHGFRESGEMDHVQGRILELVAELFSEQFGALARFCAEHDQFIDPVVGRFDREVQFCLSWLDYVARLQRAGLECCRPEVVDDNGALDARDTFDVALANTLLQSDVTIVRNTWELREPERIFVVSGPNQGGKTTFARTVGQLHYLASLGLPVPGTSARLRLPDQVYTHFEREEDSTSSGKLEDELLRIHDILRRATASSVIIMNESFSSTTLSDSRFLGQHVLERIATLDVVAVYVTFVDELSTLNEKTVSMVSTVDADDPAVRTFEVVRRPADGLAFAAAIADKYGLGYDQLRERLAT